MPFFVTFTVCGSSATEEFATLEEACEAVKSYAAEAFNSENTDEFAIHFDNPRGI